MSSAPELDRVLEAAVEHGGAVLVDLSELTFMDSTGINAFLKAALSLSGRGCLVLHGEQDRIRRVLDLVRVDASIQTSTGSPTTSANRPTVPRPTSRTSRSTAEASAEFEPDLLAGAFGFHTP